MVGRSPRSEQQWLSVGRKERRTEGVPATERERSEGGRLHGAQRERTRVRGTLSVCGGGRSDAVSSAGS